MRSLLILLILTCNAYAFEDEAFKLTKHEYKYTTEYTGKQRYCEACLRNDPEVLISTTRRNVPASGKENTPIFLTEFKAKPEDSVITVKEDKPIIVKTQFCDDYSCGEWKEQ
jgi:hypothetical protein